MKKAALACLLATGFLLPAEPDTPVEVVAGGAKAPPAPAVPCSPCGPSS